MIPPVRILLDPQGGDGNGNPPPTPPTPAPPDFPKMIEGLLAKHGDPNSALRHLLNENYGYRDRIRDLEKTLPKDGSLILSPDDRKDYEAYCKLGPLPDLRKKLDAGAEAVAMTTEFRRQETVREAAELHFPGKAKVLATLLKGHELDIREVKGAGDKVTRTAIVKGEGDTTTPLPDFLKDHMPEFLPALDDEDNRPLGTPNPQAPVRRDGVRPGRSDAEQQLLETSHRYHRL